MTYQSRQWKAVETTDLIGSKYELTVTGEVQTRKTNEKPVLIPARTPGEHELLLDLKVEQNGAIGGDIVHFVPVSYHETISSGAYHDVRIRGETDDVTVKVERVFS